MLQVAGLAANIGITTNVTAEIRAIREGLLLAKFLNIKELHLESDSKTIFDMLRKMQTESRVLHSLLKNIQALLDELEQC